MARKTKEDAEKTREMLLDAAEQVFLSHGVASASLNDIAEAAGVTRGALYWHFKNKQDVYDAMHARVKLPMDELYERAMREEEDAVLGLQKSCLYALNHVADNEHARRVFAIILTKCEQGNIERHRSRREEIIARFEKVFSQAANDGRLAAGMNAANAAIMLHACMWGIFSDYLRNIGSYDIGKIAPVYIDAVFKGLLAKPLA